MAKKKQKQRNATKSPEEIADDIVEALSILLENSGILSDGGDSDNDVDPWACLSNNLKELMVLSGKLFTLEDGNNTTIASYAKRNDLLLGMETTIHETRENSKSVSRFLPKSISIQLESCRKLESISRQNPQLPVSTQLLPLAKSLEGAIRRQKVAWPQSTLLLEDAIDQLYRDVDNASNATNTLQLLYKRVNRRCIHPDRSPWKEAIGFLESIAGATPPSNDKVSDEDNHHAVFLDPPPAKPHCIAPCLRRFDASTCASLQLPDIVTEFFDEIPDRTDQYSRILSIQYGKTPDAHNVYSRALGILVVGSEGSGKSHLLDKLKQQQQQQARDSNRNVEVLRPVLAFDAIGSTVGAAEDILISILCYAKTRNGNCLLILDDIDTIIGPVEQHSVTNQKVGRQEPHAKARLRSLFFSLLDIIRDRNYESNSGKLLLVCSSKETYKEMDRFDMILPLLPPNGDERQEIICNFVGLDTDSVKEFADYTLGLSRAEIAHHCREALGSLHSRNESMDRKDFLNILKGKLQSSTPESLKNGVNADFVDMRVLSARDLQQQYPIRNPQDAANDLPLFGKNAMDAWEDLRRLIVLPVCQSSEIDKLLYFRGGNSVAKKAFCGGVLLASSPGTGKSTLANFCASVAASIDPTVKLLDVSCTSLIHKEVGGSERALHRLFVSARSATPCIVVLDGIETIAQVRGNDNTTEGTMDRLLSTLLTELDGVDNNDEAPTRSGCMAIIGITHNPEWIDPALRRPGRLERTIWLGNPDEAGRKRIVETELANVAYDSDGHSEFASIADLATEIAHRTEGYTGAELIAICNDAKIKALEQFLNHDDKKDYITPQLVLDSVKAKPN